MGIFKLFSKKEKKYIEEEQVISGTSGNTTVEVKKEGKRAVKLTSKVEQIGYIKDNCEIILENNRQIEEAKAEYQAVTSYLTDMQKIDLIPQEERENLEDAARKIINLTKERNKLQNRNNILTDSQYRLYERYELQIPRELPTIKENEEYQNMIKQDMEHLEKERKRIEQEQKDIIKKQAYLKGIGITTAIIVLILFGVFSVLGQYTEANLTIPFLLTVLMGMVLAFYIFMEARNNTSANAMIQVKRNRQIMLMNKVKIKAVNNRNYLDYTYSKYMVDSYEQLKANWEEYVKAKDEARRYQSNTQLLEFYNNELISELKKYGLADAEIWIYQPSAILDSKEMVEVRHRLNVRRQKLRERIETNTNQKEEAYSSIKSTMKTYPECVDEAEKLLRRYRLELEE
jgi:hypothetical protein